MSQSIFEFLAWCESFSVCIEAATNQRQTTLGNSMVSTGLGIRSLVFIANRSFFLQKERITLTLFLKEQITLFALFKRATRVNHLLIQSVLLQSLFKQRVNCSSCSFCKERQERIALFKRATRAKERIPNSGFPLSHVRHSSNIFAIIIPPENYHCSSWKLTNDH